MEILAHTSTKADHCEPYIATCTPLNIYTRQYILWYCRISNDSSSKDWPKILLFFCQQVAAGVDYLSEKGFVHRDIAARNILLSEDNICKVKIEKHQINKFKFFPPGRSVILECHVIYRVRTIT